MKHTILAVIAAATLGVAGSAFAEDVDYAAQVAALGGDAAAGAKVYKKCQACHNFDPTKKKIGPHQVGVIGRPAGVVEGFKYSTAMEAAAADNPNTDAAGDGIVWDVPTLQAYLADPKGYVPKTKMSFAGLKKDEDIINVIAYLAQEGGIYEAPAQ